MASVDNSAQPNGSHQGHADNDQNNYSTQSATTPSNASATQAEHVSKDEVGWYFVEQYYTTLSRTPERLYLFYNKRSQFVSGQEAEKIEVCVGQKAINEKIQQLDFQDCKVRVTNVDSQASDSNIVIQVIGEISNKSQPHKKFTQTFVLATQPKGYFVLNDIFRYIVDDDEEADAEAANPVDEAAQPPTGTSKVEEPKTLADPAATEKVVKSLEEKVEKVQLSETTAAPTTNGDSAEEETPAAAPESKTEAAAPAESEEPKIEAEVPKDPEPTRAATPAASSAQPAAAPAPAAPAVPKTWATLAAAANSKIATPGAPAAPSAAAAPKQAKAPSATSTPAAAASAAPPATAAATTSAPAAAPAAPAKDAQDDEWTAVGGSHNRQVSRQANIPQVEVPANRGYIKSVFDNVTHEDLKAALEKFGELTHFDIARAPRNAAFVDFKTAEGFNKALNTPIEVNGEKLYVEERKPHRGNAPYPRGQFQGRGGRGGPNGAPRGGNNFSPNNRGGFTPRGRGGPTVPRGGRSQAQ